MLEGPSFSSVGRSGCGAVRDDVIQLGLLLENRYSSSVSVRLDRFVEVTVPCSRHPYFIGPSLPLV